MIVMRNFFSMPSVLKKVLMAVTGLMMVLFVFGHMLGNLQIFAGSPEPINEYAYFLHHILPGEFLWMIRLVLLGALLIHVGIASLLTIENWVARPIAYKVQKTVQASLASRTMPITGCLLLAFIIFHILHYTVRSVFDYEQLAPYLLSSGKVTFDTYQMIVAGFSLWWVSALYILAVGGLSIHLSHGISSLFQSVGLRNERVRYGLNKLSALCAVILFFGFASVPMGVLTGHVKAFKENFQSVHSITQ